MTIFAIQLEFMVTETCQNGNERRVKKSVLVQDISQKPFQAIIAEAKSLLEENHFYNVEFLCYKRVKYFALDSLIAGFVVG